MHGKCRSPSRGARSQVSHGFAGAARQLSASASIAVDSVQALASKSGAEASTDASTDASTGRATTFADGAPTESVRADPPWQAHNERTSAPSRNGRTATAAPMADPDEESPGRTEGQEEAAAQTVAVRPWRRAL
jgi:hypothetical protein